MPGDTFDRAFSTAFGIIVYLVVMAVLLAGGL